MWGESGKSIRQIEFFMMREANYFRQELFRF